MPFVPFAAFLAGALLSLLLPVGLLIALAAWYWTFSIRQPAAMGETSPGTQPTAVEPPVPTRVELPPHPPAEDGPSAPRV